jgi:protein-tyrosine phosphatase
MFNRISIAALSFALAGSTFACAEVKDLSCDQIGPTAYKLSYSLTGDSQKVQIFSSTDPSGAKGKYLILQTRATNVRVQAGTPHQRVYFFVKPDHGLEREVSIRHLPLEGTPNFRDEGGYETLDGRFIRWGLLYRSSVLTYLTPADDRYLAPLGILVICDFRTHRENEIAPETWIPDSSAEKISLPIGDGSQSPADEQPTVHASFNPADTPEQLRQHMIANYGAWVFTSSDQYAAAFQQLKNDRLPLLFHCTGGADRTGAFGAMLLLTLGVPEKVVLEDYALTSKYVGDLSSPAGQRLLKASGTDVAEAIGKLTPEQRKAIVTDPEYLRATLRRIDQKYGSFDNYRREALHVSNADVETLRARLTEK